MGQLEEVAFLADPIDRAAAIGAPAVDELGFGNKGLIDGAIPPLVLPLVQKAAFPNAPPDRLCRFDVTRLGRANEIVVRYVEMLEQRLK
jgi:hypothetical protein